MQTFNQATIDGFIKKYQRGESSLITMLQDIQEACGYLSRDALEYVSLTGNIPLSKIYSIATFYHSFSLAPRGKNLVSVCLGTACHVKNGENILHRVSRELGLESGEGTTEDRLFSMAKVRCMGCCSMAPVVRINDDTYGNVNQNAVPKLLAHYRKAEKK